MQTSAYVLVLLSVSVATLGCSPDADVKFAEIRFHYSGACNGFASSSGTVVSASPGAFTLFRIKTIENTQPGAVAFDFDPEKVHLSGEENDCEGVGFAGWDGFTLLAAAATVPPGQTFTPNQCGYTYDARFWTSSTAA